MVRPKLFGQRAHVVGLEAPASYASRRTPVLPRRSEVDRFLVRRNGGGIAGDPQAQWVQARGLRRFSGFVKEILRGGGKIWLHC
ncbi:hypothetical protein AB0I53_30965 [Saccharopolyspora sp. NPDC050389]|uniref:hypothetical protein n=1 Tax=Saccharopolyspora sp. NPDC050389 TaxID=3155516 RepID=UPI0033E8AA70